MAEPSFIQWMQGEVASAKCVLLSLYEQRDKLQYIEGPRLEREYMEKIGEFEQSVIQEEMECELLKKKQQLIRTALNRRETVNEKEIDKIINEDRQRMIQDAVGAGSPTELAELSEEKMDELQGLYKEIVKEFHPQTHPDLTDAHRELFQKAQAAYRRRDLDSMKLIGEMLADTSDNNISAEQLLELLLDSYNRKSADTAEEEDSVKPIVDYRLAGQIYSCFVHTADEAVMEDERLRYCQLADEVTKEMAETESKFPYIAAELLEDPEKLDAYKAELEHRLRSAKDERRRREAEIRSMTGKVAAHE